MAIFAVVLYHASPNWMPGGFIGVDIFFVLSGYLITGLIWREYEQHGRISIIDFWARRVRRILPTATLVLIVTSASVFVFVSPLDIADAANDILAAAYYGLNWRLAARSVDYLAPDTSKSVVLHFWSLSVEEQFYVLWPGLMLAIVVVARRLWPGRSRSSMLTTSFACIWAISLLICIYLTERNQSFAFFGTASRIWQLLSGALVVFVSDKTHSFGPTTRSIAAWISSALIVASLFLISAETPYPGIAGLVPTVSTAILILSGSNGIKIIPASLLATGALRALGRISYALYLWHFPVFLFGGLISESAGPAALLFLVLTSLMLAVATHYYFENPIRFNPMLVRSPLSSLILGVVLTSAPILIGVGLKQYARSVAVLLSDGSTVSIRQVTRDFPIIYRDGCNMSIEATKYGECIYGKASGKFTAVLFGDSHAAHWFPAIAKAASENDWKLLSRTKGGCASVDMVQWLPKQKRVYSECELWRESVLKEIERIHPQLVILANESRRIFVDPVSHKPLALADSPKAYAMAEERIAGRILRSANRLILLKDTPKFPEEPVRCLLRNPGNEKECQWSLLAVRPDPTYPYADYKSLGTRARVIDLSNSICPNSTCWAVRNGKIVMADTNHLTQSYSETLSMEFSRVFAPDD